VTLKNTPCSLGEVCSACLHGLLFEPEKDGSTFTRDVVKLLQEYLASQPRR
jgi:hypothetical protein